jgi:hypothetical protein
MAQLLHSTRFKSPSTAAASFSVTVPATAAGATLVCVAAGGATIQAKLGGVTNFTPRTTSLHNREVIGQDIVDSAGGTTSVSLTLNGAENIDGMIFEFAAGSLGSFIAGAKETDTGGNTSADPSAGTKTGFITTTGPSVVFAMFTAGDGDVVSGQRRFWGFAPLGKQFANEGIANDPAFAKYWSMIAVTDQPNATTLQGQSSRSLSGSEHQSCIWAYQDLSGGVPTYTSPYTNAIAAENSLPGSLSDSWFVAGASTVTPNLSGYTDNLSYSPGNTVNFKVYSNNAGFTVTILRLGGYGYQTFGARNQAIVTGTPTIQPAPTVNTYGGSECAWTTNATWTIPATATPGVYTYLMKRTDNSSFIAQGIFIVRSTVPVTKGNGALIVTADFTWQAYNVWGVASDGGNGYGGFTGRSLYGQAPNVAISGRAFAVSYDRPLGTSAANDGTYYWDSEAGLVNFLELNGYDVSYVTMGDIDKDPTILSKFATVIVQGHNEYWSNNFYTSLTTARDSGTNLMFLSSNTGLWHVRFDPADANRRNIICYKDSTNATGYDNTTKFDPISYTGTWRDPRTTVGGVNNTDRRPESGVTGQWFVGNGTYRDRIAVPDTYKNLPMWRNTRVATNAGIVFRGANANSMTVAGSSCTVSQPAGTQIGDLLIFTIAFNGKPTGFSGNGLRIVSTQTYDSANLTLYMLQSYANIAGTGTFTFTWGGSFMTSQAVAAYGGAVWEDNNTSVVADTSDGATHATVSTPNSGNNRWAVAAFADTTASNTSATTSWTAGTGLTSRAQGNNATAASGNWLSVALMDTASTVTQGTHQYSATAQFSNAHAAAALMYISPGTSLFEGTIGDEWDYVKNEEPSTPTNMVMLSRQPLRLAGQQSDYYGSNYSRSGTLFYGLSLYKATSGALVFNAGSWHYQWGISRFRAAQFNGNNVVDVAMQQALINLLRDFSHAPTTLLTTDANNDTTALVDPGAAQPASAYGLDAAAGVAYQSIFPVTAFPITTSAFDATDYTFGTLFTANIDGKIYGARWYFPDDLPTQQVTAALYSWTSDAAGTLLGTTAFNDPQTGWNDVLFTTPIDITSGTKYVVTVWTKDNYQFTNNYFASSGVTSGDLTAPQDNVSTHNGKFISGTSSQAYPTQSNASTGYFVDVLYIGSITFEGWGFPIS